MYGSPEMSKDLNLPFPVSPFKLGKDESDIRQQQQNHQMNSSGLLRYRSAPSNVIGDVCNETAAESMFARFVASDLRGNFGGREKQQSTTEAAVTGGFPSSGSPHMFFHSSLQEQQKQQHMTNLSSVASGVVEGNGGENLVRHGTSPASFFSNLNVENGFAGVRNMGGFSSPGGSGSGNAETRPNSGRLKGQISFNSRQGSSGIMSQISEIGSEGLGGGSSPDDAGCSGRRGHIPGFPVASWEDSALLSDSFSNGKRIRDPTEAQNHHGPPTLAHHFTLPRSSMEMAAMERFLQFQDAVPCKIRAKRGCATHPRSIAERVRRTRISERMRKLQELVPNMDKQTNTADMLDLAVNYIKDLQRQAKMLNENRANCSCSGSKLLNSNNNP